MEATQRGALLVSVVSKPNIQALGGFGVGG